MLLWRDHAVQVRISDVNNFAQQIVLYLDAQNSKPPVRIGYCDHDSKSIALSLLGCLRFALLPRRADNLVAVHSKTDYMSPSTGKPRRLQRPCISVNHQHVQGKAKAYRSESTLKVLLPTFTWNVLLRTLWLNHYIWLSIVQLQPRAPTLRLIRLYGRMVASDQGLGLDSNWKLWP